MIEGEKMVWSVAFVRSLERCLIKEIEEMEDDEAVCETKEQTGKRIVERAIGDAAKAIEYLRVLKVESISHIHDEGREGEKWDMYREIILGEDR